MMKYYHILAPHSKGSTANEDLEFLVYSGKGFLSVPLNPTLVWLDGTFSDFIVLDPMAIKCYSIILFYYIRMGGVAILLDVPGLYNTSPPRKSSFRCYS